MTIFLVCYFLANLAIFSILCVTCYSLIDEEDDAIWFYPILNKILGLKHINIFGKVILYALIHLVMLPAIIMYFVALACVITFMSIWLIIAICFSERK